jgi:hypothetical protein
VEKCHIWNPQDGFMTLMYECHTLNLMG